MAADNRVAALIAQHFPDSGARAVAWAGSRSARSPPGTARRASSTTAQCSTGKWAPAPRAPCPASSPSPTRSRPIRTRRSPPLPRARARASRSPRRARWLRALAAGCPARADPLRRARARRRPSSSWRSSQGIGEIHVESALEARRIAALAARLGRSRPRGRAREPGRRGPGRGDADGRQAGAVRRRRGEPRRGRATCSWATPDHRVPGAPPLHRHADPRLRGPGQAVSPRRWPSPGAWPRAWATRCRPSTSAAGSASRTSRARPSST